MSGRIEGIKQWLTVATNVGVLVGLLLVAIEIQQANTAMDREFLAYQQDVMDSVRGGWQTFGLLLASDRDTAAIWLKGGRGDTLDEAERERYYWLAVELFYLELQSHSSNTRYAENPESGDWIVHQMAYYVNRYPGLRSVFREELKRIPGTAFARRIAELKVLEAGEVQ